MVKYSNIVVEYLLARFANTTQEPKFNTLTLSNKVSSRNGYAIIAVFTVLGYHRNIIYHVKFYCKTLDIGGQFEHLIDDVACILLSSLRISITALIKVLYKYHALE